VDQCPSLEALVYHVDGKDAPDDVSHTLVHIKRGPLIQDGEDTDVQFSNSKIRPPPPNPLPYDTRWSCMTRNAQEELLGAAGVFRVNVCPVSRL
jgi:hypothetical protein